MGARGRTVDHDRRSEAEDPGHGGYPPGSAVPRLHGPAARGCPHPLGLQNREGVDDSPRAQRQGWVVFYAGRRRVLLSRRPVPWIVLRQWVLQGVLVFDNSPRVEARAELKK